MKDIYIFIYAEKKRRTRPLLGVPETTPRADDALEDSQDAAHSDPELRQHSEKIHSRIRTGKRTCGQVQREPGASFQPLAQWSPPGRASFLQQEV